MSNVKHRPRNWIKSQIPDGRNVLVLIFNFRRCGPWVKGVSIFEGEKIGGLSPLRLLHRHSPFNPSSHTPIPGSITPFIAIPRLIPPLTAHPRFNMVQSVEEPKNLSLRAPEGRKAISLWRAFPISQFRRLGEGLSGISIFECAGRR